jgi:hypothetical protein
MPHPARAHDESKDREESCKPASAHHWLTRAYHPVICITSRESAFRARLLRQASLDDAASMLDIG